MARLIDDLLEYSRLGRKALRFGPVPLAEVMGHLRQDFAPRLAEEGGELVIAADMPEVRGEATLLGRLFSNLVDNALAYRKPGEPAKVRIDWQAAGERVEVRVSDQGIGIPPEHHAKIFDVFQRLHGEDEVAGTGIGLAVVKKVADLLDGEVRVESEPGKGSTFAVTLPRPGKPAANIDGEEDE
jgi:signal transduction histidine kinase